ncbi:MAG TPA: aminopeptidase [Clostridia bacterium]|nr:aminopeptidase [Clostridia bacterium]HPK16493.1 aminopeptidase [Clostridia bacterium]
MRTNFDDNKELVELSDKIAEYSLKLKANERCLIWTGVEALPLARLLSGECLLRGAIPYTYVTDEALARDSLAACAPDSGEEPHQSASALMGGLDYWLGQADAVAVLRCKNLANAFEGVPAPAMDEYLNRYGMQFRSIIKKKWVLMDYPTPLQAKKANMSFDSFYEYCLKASLLDYALMRRRALPLKTLMDVTDRIRVIGDGTDFSFSKRGIDSVLCTGEHSYVDGEIYTAPLRHSLEGAVTYNIPTSYMGYDFEGIRLVFREGEIIEAGCRAGSAADLQRILHADDGASFIGEFALGLNPLIAIPMNDLHYDEKILGSFHLTPGQCYPEASNGNRSAIHWDMVSMLTPKYGGGEIWFDGTLVQRDGRFVPPELLALNGK